MKKKPGFDEIKEIIQNVKDETLYGINVTVPFKQTVIKYLDNLSPLAKKTNSVNTIFKKNGKIYGDNTDIIGFELSILDLKISLKGKTALIIGAGGVVPSIIVALQNLGTKEIYIMNRTTEKVETIKSNFNSIHGTKWGDLGNHDIYINATSVGLKKGDDLNLDIVGLEQGKLLYDVIYNPSMTNFLEKAKNHGHQILNGENMFLYQAQKAFELWHNISPKIDNFLIDYLKMIRIALIGGIGSGKSYLAKLFGYPIFNADLEVSKFTKRIKIFF